jgi:hypothetical protein
MSRKATDVRRVLTGATARKLTMQAHETEHASKIVVRKQTIFDVVVT